MLLRDLTIPSLDPALAALLAPAAAALPCDASAAEAAQAASLATLPEPPLDPLALIDRELTRLFAARELYLAWSEEARREGQAGFTPAQFLRAWSESTGRVLQLLRARAELAGGGADRLLDAIYAELERALPAAPEPDLPVETEAADG